MHNDKNNAGFELTTVEKKESFPSDILWSYQEGQEKRPHLRDYIEILFRRKWIVIVFFISVVGVVTLGSFLMKPVYKATSTLQIKRVTPNIVTFKDDYQAERLEKDYYLTQYKVLKSRNLAGRVITKLSSEKEPEFSNSGLISSAILEEYQERVQEGDRKGVLIDAFLGKLEVEPIKSSQLVNVSFLSRNPVFATKVTNTVADEYIRFTLESQLEPTQQARGRLEKEVEAMKARLEESEEQFNEYIARSQIIFLKKEKDPESLLSRKLSELSKEFDRAIADRITKEAIYREVEKSGVNYSVVLQNPLIQSLTMEYTKLESEYFNLLKVHKPEYPKMQRLEKQIEQMKRRIEGEEQKIVDSLDSDYNIALTRERYLSSVIEKLRHDVIAYQQKMVHYQILKREVETNRDLYNSLLQRLKEVGVSTTLTESNIQILDRAEVPRKPYRPQKALNIGLSLILGLFGGVFLAFFAEYFDNSVKNVDDIEKKSRLPVLGMVPISKTNPKELISDNSNDNGPFAEAFRSLGTYIRFTSTQKPPKQILVTSPLAKDGKTLLSTNIAKSFVSLFGKGIVVDADLRRPSIHSFFNLDNSTGLSSFLSGATEYNGLIKKSPCSGFDVITSGPIPANPHELLNSSRMKELVDALSAKYDYVIIDSAPVLGISDSLILTQFIEAVLVVVKAANTPRDALIQTIKLLNGVNAKILGLVLNGLDLKRRYGYSYGHAYYYPFYARDKKEI